MAVAEAAVADDALGGFAALLGVAADLFGRHGSCLARVVVIDWVVQSLLGLHWSGYYSVDDGCGSVIGKQQR